MDFTIFSRLAARLRELGPYFLVELLLPGGSVIALFLWWRRHRHDGAGTGRRHGLFCPDA